jgi:hypothetical protein
MLPALTIDGIENNVRHTLKHKPVDALALVFASYAGERTESSLSTSGDGAITIFIAESTSISIMPGMRDGAIAIPITRKRQKRNSI